MLENKIKLANYFIIDTTDSRGELLLSSLQQRGYLAREYVSGVCAGENAVFIFTPKFLLTEKEALALPSGCKVFLHSISYNTARIFTNKKISFYPYLENALVIEENAHLTALGTLEILKQKYNSSILEKSILVLGGGFVAKALVQVFSAARLQFSVSERSKKIENSFPLTSLPEKASDFDIVVNSIPAKVITKEVLLKLKKGVFILDLASKPGGVDFLFSSKQNIEVAHQLSIPGRFYPAKAGQIIEKFVFEVLTNKRGESE